MSTQALNRNSTLSLLSRSDDDDLSASVQNLVSEISVAKYFAVALATALTYHFLLTLDKEVHFFWTKSQNRISLVYFLNHFAGFAGAICTIISQGLDETRIRCKVAFWIASSSNLIIVVLIDCNETDVLLAMIYLTHLCSDILLIRVLALFHQAKKPAIVLKVLLGLDAAAGLALLIRGNVFEKTTAIPVVDGLSVCGGFIPPQSETIISWVIPLVYGLILLVLALWKAAEYWKMSSGFKGFELVKVVVQDQLFYYGFAISCCVLRITNICVVGINQFAASTLAAVASPTFLCILGAHLLINLKEAGERGVNEGTSYKTVSAMEFS